MYCLNAAYNVVTLQFLLFARKVNSRSHSPKSFAEYPDIQIKQNRPLNHPFVWFPMDNGFNEFGDEPLTRNGTSTKQMN